MAVKQPAEKKPVPPGRQPNPHSLMLTPDEAMREIRCSRATLFKLLQPGPGGEPAEIDSFLLGPNARRIPRTEIEAYMRRKLAEGSTSGERDAA